MKLVLDWLVARIPTWVPVALILALTALGILLLHQRNSARLDTAEVRAELAQQQRDAAVAFAVALAKLRSQEATWRSIVENATRALLAERKAREQTQAAFVAARTERDGLLQQVAAYARGDPATDTLAACRDRADALGEVFGEALRDAEDCQAAAETEAANVRTLLSTWPR